MADFGTAIVGASAVIIVGYVTNFVGERYRRFLDARALASALLGELTGHQAAFPLLEESFGKIVASRRRGTFRVTEVPTSPVFDNLVEKIGSLGHPLAGDVAYIYERIRAFRSVLMTIVREGKEMDDDEYFAYMSVCLGVITGDKSRLDKLLADLEKKSTQAFDWMGGLPFSPRRTAK